MAKPQIDGAGFGGLQGESGLMPPLDRAVLDENPAGRDRTLERRRRAQLRLLRMHYESGVGHLGGNLSCLDLMLVLYHDVLESIDQFVLSKGHSAGALYVSLWSTGKLEDEELRTFHKDGTRLSGHPPTSAIPEILFATGSLGHGLSLAAGLALAKRLKGEAGRVYCLMSDGEWNEGSCWEALIFALHHQLDNLTIMVDLNGLQGFGTTHEVANLDPLADKFRAFGASTLEIDGHDHDEIRRALAQTGSSPRMIVARTHKACGLSFFQDRMESHYLPLTESQYLQAVRETEETCERSSASRS